jgi:hypothetical protein
MNGHKIKLQMRPARRRFFQRLGLQMMIAGKQQDPLLGLNVAAQLIQKIVQLIVG